MRYLCLAAVLLLGAFHAPARADAFADCAEHLPLGAPTVAAGPNTSEVCHAGYAALVDNDALVPRWVAYHLTGPHTLGCLDRTDNFHADAALLPPRGPDGKVAKIRRATPSDYALSGYDMGHMADAADFEWGAQEERDSFSLANMAPQLPGLNRQGWERGEETVRAWAWQRGDVFVYVGPILKGDEKTIGPDHIVVPGGFWKVVVDAHSNQAIGLEMPQQAIAKGDLAPYLKSIAQIEVDAQIELPMPAAIDKGAAPVLWPADLAGWNRAHKAACAH